MPKKQTIFINQVFVALVISTPNKMAEKVKKKKTTIKKKTKTKSKANVLFGKE